MKRLTPEQLRSYRWFGPNDLRSFGHRSRARQMGLASADWQGKPVIAIFNTVGAGAVSRAAKVLNCIPQLIAGVRGRGGQRLAALIAVTRRVA